MALERITAEDFRPRVLRAKEPALVAFTAAFCEASQELLPVLDEVSGKFEGRGRVFALDLGDDVDKARANKIAQRYGVNRLPAVVAISDGRPKDMIGGLTRADDLVDMLDRQVRPVREVIGAKSFRSEVLESKEPVLVHFHAGNCEQSAALFPVIDATAETFRGRAKVVRVEANVFNASVMERYGAIRTPMLAAFDDGEMKDSIMGTVVDQQQLIEGDGRDKAVAHISEMLEALV